MKLLLEIFLLLLKENLKIIKRILSSPDCIGLLEIVCAAFMAGLLIGYCKTSSITILIIC